MVVFRFFVRETEHFRRARDRITPLPFVPFGLIPVVTVLGLQFGSLLGGAFFIEAVFARPGLGRLVIGAIQGRDTALVMGAVVVGATAYVLINFVMDLLYGWLDPRISYE